MSNVQRISLDPEVNELIDTTRGTNEAFAVLSVAAGDEREIPLDEAVETCKRIAADLPREQVSAGVRLYPALPVIEQNLGGSI